MFRIEMNTKTKELATEYGPDLNCGCGVSAWHMPYDDFIQNLKRDELPAGHWCEGCSLGAGVMEDNLHMIVYLISKRYKAHIRNTINYIKKVTSGSMDYRNT